MNCLKVSVEHVFDTWPQYKDWQILHEDQWCCLHDIMSNADQSYIWIDFVLDAHDEEAGGPGMRVAKDDLVTIRNQSSGSC